MLGIVYTELSAWTEVSVEFANIEGPHHRSWFQHVGKTLGILLFNAGYSYGSQYRSLVFSMRVVAPNLGIFHISDAAQPWNSFMTDDGSPVELSWDWGTSDSRPTIRYSIEPIGQKAGTSLDPLNLLIGPVLEGQLIQAVPDLSLEWLYHFQGFFNCPGATRQEMVDLQDHSTSIFYAFDLTDTGTTAKVYLFPRIRAMARNESNLEALVQSIKTAPYVTEDNLNALAIFTDFSGDTANVGLEYEMLAIDMIDPEHSRLKIYFRCRETSFDSVVNIMTLGGRISHPNFQQGVNDLRDLWSALFTACAGHPLKEVHHRTAGMLYNIEFKLGDLFPVAKIYIPVRHYSSSDDTVIWGLERYFQSRKRGTYMKAYTQVMTDLFGSETLSAQSGVQTYVGCSIRPDGALRLVSYFKPPLSTRLTSIDKVAPLS
ncbi:tryptophan dimethylallyltransferase-domain-containing protein [Xylaria sp. FL0933]|nr:tryptophan dimethylallyltransferase-domain-containing protein [Xylaria sp. FL0933]